MSALRLRLEDYLALRRSMGFKLERAGKLLSQYVAYCEAAGAEHVTIQLALGWATLPKGGNRSWVAHRLSVVRGFARHLALIDELTEVPPTDLLFFFNDTATTEIYTDDEVRKLMAAAETLRTPIRRATFQTLLALLWVTGMRIGEALRLNRDDVDLTHGVLVLRESKFGKSREIPVHESATVALHAYAKLRDELSPQMSSPAFFVSLAGKRLRYDNFHLAFVGLVRKAGITRRSPACRPRPHDLRHSFAVRTLVGWYQDGGDVASRLPWLSTYLGHVHPANTYWYLSASPELLGLAAERLERSTEGQP